MAEQAKVPAIRFAGFTDPWEQRKLGDVAPLQRGFDLPVNQMTPGPYPVVMSNGIGGWHSKYMVKGPGVVTGRSGTIGSLHYIEQNFWPHNTSLWVTSFNGNEPRFIYWLYASIGLERFGSGSGVPTLNRNDVHDLRVGFPCDVAEQRRIGTFFSRLDSLITLHQRKYDKLVIFKKSMLEKMFPKDGESVPEIRFAGFTDPWEQRKLGNCGTTYSGLSGKTKEDFGHGNARFVPYTNVFDNPLADTERLEAVEIDSSQNKVAYGDVFFTVSSETPNEVGMSSVWLSDQDDVYLNSFCFGYRQDSTFDPHYLAYMLRSSSIRSDLTLLAQGISRFNISKNKVMELSVAVPSAAEQKQIGQYFARLDDLITLHQRKLELLQNIKKSLLDKMFV